MSNTRYRDCLVTKMAATRLKGKSIFLTAAAQGIGRACAIRFAKEGARVLATDINFDKLKDLKEIDGIEIQHLDVSSKAQVDSVTSQVHEVDGVVNCAAIVRAVDLLSCSDDDWHSTLDVNITGVFYVCRALLPRMLEKKKGSIVNLSSVASSVLGVPQRASYGPSKGAVIGLTKSIAVDFANQGIRCNAICPGTIDTPSVHERLSALPNYQDVLHAATMRHKLGRIGTPDEVAQLAAFLVSDESSFITGQHIVIDGGWSLG